MGEGLGRAAAEREGKAIAADRLSLQRNAGQIAGDRSRSGLGPGKTGRAGQASGRGDDEVSARSHCFTALFFFVRYRL